MKILFYGGCHASALARIFSRYLPQVEHETLINFRLIADKKPFPYDMIARFDAVVFNPIIRAGYETTALVDHCQSHGVKSVSYPWLHWAGYWPGGVAKRVLPFYDGWLPAGVMKQAANYPHYGDFAEAVAAGLGGEDAEANLERCTAILRKREEAASVDIPMSGFIAANCRQHRLFQTIDHATNALYVELVDTICDRLGLARSRWFREQTTEVQEDVVLPILPGVRRALGLAFRSGEFLPGRGDPLLLPDFLRLIHAAARAEGTIWVALNQTDLKSGGQRRSVRPGALLVAAPGERTRKGELRTHDAFGREWIAYGPHWKPYPFETSAAAAASAPAPAEAPVAAAL